MPQHDLDHMHLDLIALAWQIKITFDLRNREEEEWQVPHYNLATPVAIADEMRASDSSIGLNLFTFAEKYANLDPATASREELLDALHGLAVFTKRALELQFRTPIRPPRASS